MIVKKDPFDGKDPKEIKQNILTLEIESEYFSVIPQIFKPILEACFSKDENLRPTA